MKQHKKFLVWICNILAVVFIFGLVGCAPMGNGGDSSADTSDTEIVDITAYKAERIDELFAYCKDKLDENYYSETSYGLLLDCLQESVKDINAADDIASIDSICQNAKTEIDGMDTMETAGAFYVLQEAYETEYLTLNDLMHISYYKWGSVCSGDPYDQTTWNYIDFYPQNDCPNLNIQVEKDIKKFFYESKEELFFDKEGNRLGDESDLFVNFYGCYNGSYVVEITSTLWTYGSVVSYLILDEIFITYNSPYFLVFRYE